ncbi:MAG: hypothetical protein ACI4NP_05070 [Thermoguttaceae bacterium]
MNSNVFELSVLPPGGPPKASKTCSETGRAFAPGEKIYSIIYYDQGELARKDMCVKAWKGFRRPESTLAWWSSRVPSHRSSDDRKKTRSPNDALVSLFEELLFKPEEKSLLYALALLLVRRRVFRFEFENARAQQKPSQENARQDSIFVYSSRNDACYAIPVVRMTQKEMDDVQNRLVDILDNPDNIRLSTHFETPCSGDLVAPEE